ncbi:hypothetical protein EOK75_10175 [Pseudorhodobacter turbinis]|uniref:Nickel/cobalt efflux system n=1 Tax=Pseudorhodobacter turbinis TaxID=2500533 RepID=A0A4P8EGM5_9RHOB|nr:hypothetical protein [Pseudorhodobacter turbinis]QCO56066.1 hypothetical protein EOK75_10175 [Pseudorhodobacter turbinis]
MRLIHLALVLAGALVLAVLLMQVFDFTAVMRWAAQMQRDFQNAMAVSLRAIRAGDAAALLTLCGLTFGYGFVHAIGPGHGKFLLGAAAVSSRATIWRMAFLTLVSSLAQSLAAVLLVTGGIQLVSLTSASLIDITERLLAPISYGIIGLIGALLAVRGARAVWGVAYVEHDHGPEGCSCGHKHGPSMQEVDQAMTWREMLALIASIAIRPCTGALFLLVIAWRLQILPAGILATFAMGLGTAAFNMTVVGSGVGARVILSALGTRRGGGALFLPIAQITAGLLVAIVSIGMLRPYL